jgi:hypothetical protein
MAEHTTSLSLYRIMSAGLDIVFRGRLRHINSVITIVPNESMKVHIRVGEAQHLGGEALHLAVVPMEITFMDMEDKY